MSTHMQMRTPQHQQGGTLLGVIIGLVVGLAIAVVVALAITKGSTPFTNKLKNERTAEVSGPITDPNKPLYSGKEAAKEAAKEFAAETSASAAVTPTPTTTPATPTQVAKVEPKPALPGADKTPTPTTTPKATDAKVDNVDEKWTYYLQAGAFREQIDAESTKAKLALLGFEANISERNSDNGILYRVRVGPFNQVDAMNRTRSKLSENGVEVAVVRNQK